MTNKTKLMLFTTLQPELARECVKWLQEAFNLRFWIETTDLTKVFVECPESLIGTLQIKAIAFARGWNAKK